MERLEEGGVGEVVEYKVAVLEEGCRGVKTQKIRNILLSRLLIHMHIISLHIFILEELIDGKSLSRGR